MAVQFRGKNGGDKTLDHASVGSAGAKQPLTEA
jgi:hypothetical protein